MMNPMDVRLDLERLGIYDELDDYQFDYVLGVVSNNYPLLEVLKALGRLDASTELLIDVIDDIDIDGVPGWDVP